MISVRERVVAEIATLLQAIDSGDGYSISPEVYRAKREVLDTLLPIVTVWDQAEETEAKYNAFEQKMTVQIEAMREVVSPENFSVIGNELIADIKRAVFAENLNPVNQGITPSTSSITYPDSGTSIVKVTVEILVNYTEVRGDPTAIPNL